jgi:hypothetical protein
MEPAAGSPPSLSMSPTITSPAMMTGVGMILGTAAYMSPEQAKGRTVDRRADVWAFGAVLYEMLSGHRAFVGEDISDTLANVLKTEPDWSRLPAETSPRVRLALRACLQKDPKQRIGDLQSVRLALDGAFEAVAVHPADAQVARVVRPPMWRRALSLVVTAVVVAAAAAGVAWTLRPHEPRLVVRSVHMLPAGTQFLNPNGGLVAISEDGRQLVYNAAAGLTLRVLDSLDERRIPGGAATGINTPFFAPDGQSVGYLDQSNLRLRRISVNGGPSQQFTKRLDGVQGGARRWRDRRGESGHEHLARS